MTLPKVSIHLPLVMNVVLNWYKNSVYGAEVGQFFEIAIVGDITPYDGISKAEKNRRERDALEHMCKLLGGGPRGLFLQLHVVCSIQ